MERTLPPRDRLASVFFASTSHDESQPAHLKVLDTSICIEQCAREFGNPCQRFCPANVYEIVDDGAGGKRLQINAANCVHCKACDIKDPYEIINWTPPKAARGRTTNRYNGTMSERLAPLGGPYRRLQPDTIHCLPECPQGHEARRLRGAVYAWSVSQPEDFWTELARFADVRADWGHGPVLQDRERMPGARFFPNARLNFAAEPAALSGRSRRHRVRQRARRTPADLATASCAQRSRASPRACGRRVSARAIASRASCPTCRRPPSPCWRPRASGAIWSSCSPDFGVQGVLDRFGQIAPKVLFTADGYFYAGKTLDSLTAMAEVAAQLPSVRAGRRHPLCGARSRSSDASGQPLPAPRVGKRSASAAQSLQFASFPFNHPLYILYSSGTTGVPKCIVHGAGGTLLQHQKEHLLHTDLQARRPPLLFHDLRLDDVELADERARHRARRSSSMTAARSIRTRSAVEIGASRSA